MAQTSLTSISGALKRIYDDYVDRSQNLKTRSIDKIGKSAKKYNAGGEGFFGAINNYGNESVGALNEAESFRTIDAENYVQWKVVPKVLVAPIQFSGLSAKAAEGDEESFVNVVVDALERARDRLLSDENRQFFGLGTGALASPSAAVASDVTSLTVDSTQYLRANAVVDIFDSGGTKRVDSIRISRVDRQTGIVYFATSLGYSLTTTAVIVKENVRDSAASDGKEAMGLRGIVDDSTDLTTFQNINASTTDEWKAIRTSASSANLTSDLLQRLMDDVEILSGETPDLILMHPLQRRKYLDIVTPQKRFMDDKMDAGFSGLSFNGMELQLDKDCQTDTVYAVSKKHLRRFEVAPLAMAEHDDSGAYLKISNQDAYQAYWRHYMNWGTDRRIAHGKLVSLAVPSGIK